MRSLADLAATFRAGDAAALEEIADALDHDLWAIAGDDPERYIATLDALARAAARDDVRDHRAFFLASARNAVRDFVKSERSRARHIAPLTEAADVPDTSPNPEAALIAAEEEAARDNAFAAALAALPAEQADVIRLRYFDGKTALETAVTLGISERTVYRYEAAALATLRNNVRHGSPADGIS